MKGRQHPVVGLVAALSMGVASSVGCYADDPTPPESDAGVDAASDAAPDAAADAEADSGEPGCTPGPEAWTIEEVMPDAHGATDVRPSLVIGPDGVAHVVSARYFVDELRAELRYATQRSGEWVHEVIAGWEGAGVQEGWSVTVDDSGMVRVVYEDDEPSDSSVWLATRGEDGWGTAVVSEWAQMPASALDGQGNLLVAYHDPGRGRGGDEALELMVLPPDGDPRVEVVIAGGATGRYPSLVVGPDGTAHVVFLDACPLEPFSAELCWGEGGLHVETGALRHATKEGGSWEVETVDETMAQGTRAAVAVDAAGAIHVAYVALDAVRYATNAGGSWDRRDVEASPSETWWWRETAIAVDSRGLVHMTYGGFSHDAGNGGGLRYAVASDGSWETEEIDLGVSDLSEAALAVGRDDLPAVAYLRFAGDLRRLRFARRDCAR